MSPLSCLTSPVLSPISYIPWPASHHPTPFSHILSSVHCPCLKPPISHLLPSISASCLLSQVSHLLSTNTLLLSPVSCVLSCAAEPPLIWAAPDVQGPGADFGSRQKKRLRLQAKKGSSRRLRLQTLNFSFQLCKISLLIKIKFCDPVPLRRITVTAVNAKVNFRALLL